MTAHRVKPYKPLAVAAAWLALGLAATSAHAVPVLDVSGAFSTPGVNTYTFMVSDITTPYMRTFTDLGIPAPFLFSASATFLGSNVLATVIGSGSTVFSFGGTGTYGALVSAFPGSSGGSYQLTISPVPEASTWALMLAGLALVGWRLRRNAGSLAAASGGAAFAV